jgi:hypothetical protein
LIIAVSPCSLARRAVPRRSRQTPQSAAFWEIITFLVYHSEIQIAILWREFFGVLFLFFAFVRKSFYFSAVCIASADSAQKSLPARRRLMYI